MSLVVELPTELELELANEASRLGVSMSDYVLRILATRCPNGEPLRNGSELLAYWEREGLIGTRPDIANSVKHARALREQAEKRGEA